MSKLVRLAMTKTILYLTEQELVKLLAADPDLWKKAIQRGKYEKRRQRWAGEVKNGPDN